MLMLHYLELHVSNVPALLDALTLLNQSPRFSTQVTPSWPTSLGRHPRGSWQSNQVLWPAHLYRLLNRQHLGNSSTQLSTDKSRMIAALNHYANIQQSLIYIGSNCWSYFCVCWPFWPKNCAFYVCTFLKLCANCAQPKLAKRRAKMKKIPRFSISYKSRPVMSIHLSKYRMQMRKIKLFRTQKFQYTKTINTIRKL